MKRSFNRRIVPAAPLVAFAVSLLLVAEVAAMSSPHYRLDWYTPLTSAGGGPTSSTNYQVNITMGQPALGAAASTHYQLGLGYWSFSVLGVRVYLPVIVR